MTDFGAYRESLAYLRTHKQALTGFFTNASDLLATLAPMDAEAVSSLQALTLASESTYIDIQTLLPLAVHRNELSVFSRLLHSLSTRNPAYADVLVSSYPSLSFPLREIQEDIMLLVDRFPAKGSRGKKVLTFCLRIRDQGACRFLLHQLGIVASLSPGSLFNLVSRLPKTMRSLSADAFIEWMSRGTDLMTSNRIDEGVRFFMGRSRESRRMLGVTTAVLDDLRSVLKIYCASLAGKEMAVVSLEASSFGLSAPYTDGSTIFLPPEIGLFDASEMNERMYTVLAARLAAEVALGTFHLDLAAIDFEDELHDRYGTALPRIMDHVRKRYGRTAKTIRERPSGDIEVIFPSGRKIVVLETEHEKFFYSFPAPDFAWELFNLVECSRIERALSMKYPGFKEDALILNTRLWDNRPFVPDPGGDPGARFRAALECLIQFSLQGTFKCVISDPHLGDLVLAIIREFRGTQGEDVTVQDSARICFRIYTLFHDNFPVVAYCAENDIREVFADPVRQEICPEIVLDASPELLKERENGAWAAEIPESGERMVDLTDHGVSDEKADFIRRSVASGSLRLYRYPEYDFSSASYLPRHCTLYERTLESVESDFYRNVMRDHKRTLEQVKKRFLALQPEGMEISRRWPSGEEIHLSDAVDYSIDLLRGASPEETIYFRKIRNTRDIIAALLVDASSSTDEIVNRQRIIDIEKASLVVLASALSLIGDDFGIFSYFSLGRHKVFSNVVKDFFEPWDSKTQGRLSSIQAYASNRDGCAIRHAAARLADHPHRTKLLLILSDGIPADVGYGSSSSADTSEYAIEDTRRSILECRMKGIVPYCITIDKAARSYISHVYGDYHYTVIDDVSALPQRLSRLYLRLTR